MNYQTVYDALQKARAVLDVAMPSSLAEYDRDRTGWLIHVGLDYVEKALEDLDPQYDASDVVERLDPHRPTDVPLT